MEQNPPLNEKATKLIFDRLDHLSYNDGPRPRGHHLPVKIISELANIPTYGSVESAGLDLYSTVDGVVDPGERVCVPIGIQMAIPSGYYGRIAPRSGLAYRNGVDILAGVIDSDYR